MDIKEVETHSLVKELCRRINEDPSYYIAWQSAIAMAFQDEFYKMINGTKSLHEISNDAAKNFLRQLSFDGDR